MLLKAVRQSRRVQLGRFVEPTWMLVGHFPFCVELVKDRHDFDMVKLQRFLVGFVVATMVTLASTAAKDLAAENQLHDLSRLLDESDSGEDSASLSSDYGSSAADSLDASTTGMTGDVAPAPTATTPLVVQPVVDGVKMFGQCGGIFYEGSTTCSDPDAYCKQLSIYSSICSPKPVK
ncbi:unnamed protein product [Phytophthora lilii]|uniref:Unnamed protein product n=1 Tax=Phytophthora lilii TaxID=2077276 RepID=A0A9W6WMM7_9STRA|nr:unnamed protein product [Phytophthora lilii]